MMGKRLLVAAMTLVLVSAGGVGTADAGAPATFNQLFQKYSMTVNGTYIPLIGDLDCTGAGGNLAIVWYAPGTGADHRWTNLDATESGQLEYSTAPLPVNGVYKPFVGDFDGDTCDDIFWYAPGTASDYVWYGEPEGGFESQPVTVNGTYTPLVGNWDDNTAGDDVFWYAHAGGTESIWRGTATRGTFGNSTAPQVSGIGYRTSSFGEGILFYQPGPAADYFWEDVIGGASAPGASVQVTINGTYQPYFASGILLYGPGADPDRFIYDYSPDGELGTLEGTINGTYRVAVPPPSFGEGLIFHAPGSAPDSLWVGGMAAAGASFGE